MFITPKKFSELTGENYELILDLCKKGSIRCERTDGGHYKIYKTEFEKFNSSSADYISKERFEAILRENEMLKERLRQIIKIADL
ncbi:DNA-binding protein [Clostridium tertium]|uniref:DNA-binding protein n=1 Tax=Clostridium tertium TaxID=1559 RepID=UPI001AE69525|nr:DNA-binding protein [Clostridium tertium]MBP1868760.1 excisionase family DNA binding protein [Clostridium tertium]